MEEMTEFIRSTMQSMIHRSRHGAFRSEDQIQGYFEGRAKDLLPAECEYVAERRTTTKYVRKLGCLEKSERGRQGRFDAVVKSPSGRTAGIEIQYPRGKGITDRSLFISHVKNDIRKLVDEKDLDERYLLVFTYNDLPDEGGLEKLADDAGTVNLCRIRLAKQAEDARTKPVVDVLTVPRGWISFDQIQ